MWWWLVVAVAVATEGEPELVADGEVPLVEFLHDGSDDMIVWGELQVEAARQEVIRELRAQGYTREIRKKGKSFVIFRHPQASKGEVLIYDDGWIKMRRQPVIFEGPKMPWAPRNSAGAWAGCLIYPWACVKLGGVLIGKRKFIAHKRRTLVHVEDDATQFAERLADHSTAEWANDLPAELERLWVDGVPIEGGQEAPVIETPSERRGAILAFWGSRTETPWGEQIRAAVEAFLRGEVQCGEHPVTRAELDAFNADRFPYRPLVISGCSGEALP